MALLLAYLKEAEIFFADVFNLMPAKVPTNLGTTKAEETAIIVSTTRSSRSVNPLFFIPYIENSAVPTKQYRQLKKCF